MSNENAIIARITALLAKAESTTPEEAELLTAKAGDLMLKYSIDQARLSAATTEAPGDYYDLHTAVYEWSDYLAIGRERLIMTVVMRIPGAYSLFWRTGRGRRVRVWADDQIKLDLIASILRQGEASLKLWWSIMRTDEMQARAYKHKNDYLWGFGVGAAHRLDARRALLEESDSKALVLVTDRVASAVTEHLGEPKIGRKARKTAHGSFTTGVIHGEDAHIGNEIQRGSV